MLGSLGSMEGPVEDVDTGFEVGPTLAVVAFLS